MLKQRFDEDRAELEAHFAERVQAYVELGETPEQARASAREKFGETEAVMQELRWQRVVRSPITSGIVSAVGYLLVTVICKHAGINLSLWGSAVFSMTYTLYLWKAPRRCKRAR